MKMDDKRKVIEDFERMVDMAKLRVLSKRSLEAPLSDDEADEMIALGKKLGFPIGGSQ